MLRVVWFLAGDRSGQDAAAQKARMTSYISSWPAALVLVLAMSASAWGSQENPPGAAAEDSWLDEYLAQELQFDEAQIARFKENVADMPEDRLKALLHRMKAQRELQDPQTDINATDRERRLEENQLNLRRIADEKSDGERFTTEDYKKYWNYGAQPRRTYRALFRQRRGFYWRVW